MSRNINKIWEEFSSPLKMFIKKRVQNDYDAEDILHNVFLKIFLKINTLKNDDKLQSWIYQITRHEIIDYYRTRKQKWQLSEGVIYSHDDFSLDHDFVKGLTGCVNSIVEQLPNKYKKAIIMTEVEGLTQKELAIKLGLSYSGAKSRVQRGKVKLKNMLTSCCYFDFDCFGNVIDYRLKNESCTYCCEISIKK